MVADRPVEAGRSILLRANEAVQVVGVGRDQHAELVQLDLNAVYTIRCKDIDTSMTIARSRRDKVSEVASSAPSMTASLTTLPPIALGRECAPSTGNPYNLEEVDLYLTLTALNRRGGQATSTARLNWAARLRVATYNMLNAQRDRSLDAAARRLSNADIAMLQEISIRPSYFSMPPVTHQPAILAQRTGLRHWYFKERKLYPVPNKIDPDKWLYATGLAILSRYPLIDPTFEYVTHPACTSNPDPDKNRTVILKARTIIDGVEYLLLNSHFNASACVENRIASGMRVADLMQSYAGPVIFGADANQGHPGGVWHPALQPIISTPGIADTASAPLAVVTFDGAGRRDRCYHMVSPGWVDNPNDRLDFIFTKQVMYDIATYDQRCVSNYSDHPFVLARFG